LSFAPKSSPRFCAAAIPTAPSCTSANNWRPLLPKNLIVHAARGVGDRGLDHRQNASLDEFRQYLPYADDVNQFGASLKKH
jgi:hypothetical protein